eukprot:scaffold7608_cov62-Phaeocystis_antarctica.AAC.6
MAQPAATSPLGDAGAVTSSDAGAARPCKAHRAEMQRDTHAGLIIAAKLRWAADEGRPAACWQPAVVPGFCL